jgi:glutamate-ammonia-ligase adenylyltransferase
MGVSQFLWEDFLREQHENLFPVVRDVPALDTTKPKDGLREELATADHSSNPIARLNQFKDREMFRIDLRHITGRIDLARFSQELTNLAEVVIEEACRLCHETLQNRFGTPTVEQGRPCAWSVCGLGKFGGRELGYASDIELLFVYEAEGQKIGTNAISNSRYFEEFVVAFLQTLRTRREGIFQIDLRLRPHGKAGSLACSLESFTHYFSTLGDARQFERLALVKLRPVAGDASLADRISQARDAFVYSGRPIDYDNIQHLRQRQASELVSLRALSAKHSLGGLVDLEYFVQAKQIEIGHANPSVRVTGTLDAIARLQQAGAFSAEQARELSDAFRFLRRLIEALRVVRGHAQDLTIPRTGTIDFAHLARRLHFDFPAALASEIDRQMAVAQELWTTTRFSQR